MRFQDAALVGRGCRRAACLAKRLYIKLSTPDAAHEVQAADGSIGASCHKGLLPAAGKFHEDYRAPEIIKALVVGLEPGIQPACWSTDAPGQDASLTPQRELRTTSCTGFK